MNSRPLVSILTPVFNQRAYIRKTLQSVLNQTYKNWEWIILDDGSTDDTGDIIKSAHDSRMRYFYQEHAGIQYLTKTYNKALSLCKGSYVAMLDHDDYWPEYKLEVQVKGFDEQDIVLSYGECVLVNGDGRKMGYLKPPADVAIAGNNPVGSALRILIVDRYCFIINSTVMFRKSALLKIGGFVKADGLYHDYPTWVRLSLEGRFLSHDLCLGYWRRHPSSISVRNNKEVELFDSGIEYIRRFIPSNEKKLRSLGFFFDMDYLEDNWRKRRAEFATYLPYNKTMLMLNLGRFEVAASEFEKYVRQNPSIKNKIIWSLIKLSGSLHADIVTPLAAFKNLTVGFFTKWPR